MPPSSTVWDSEFTFLTVRTVGYNYVVGVAD